MSRSSALGAFEYALESSFAENASTVSGRLAVLGEIDASGLTHAKVSGARTVQRLQDGTMGVRGVMGGEFTIELWIPGHGSTTAGAITLEEHEDFLGYVFGNATSSGTGTTGTGSGSVTSSPTASASGLTVGGVVFCGSLGDGRGGGQPSVVSAHGSSTLTHLTAIPGILNNGDVIASSVCIYATETAASASASSLRCRLLTANQQYLCHGCYPTSVRITGLSPGEIPRISITFGVAWWEPVSVTFPTATGVDAFNPAPCAGGSLFIQNSGTATRQTYNVRSFELEYTIGVVAKVGPGGVNAFQSITELQRSPATIRATVVVDAEAATASPTWPGRWDSDSQYYHLLYGLNGAATGKRVALYAPNACMTERKPVQMGGGINRERLSFDFYTGGTTTSELTLSALRLALG